MGLLGKLLGMDSPVNRIAFLKLPAPLFYLLAESGESAGPQGVVSNEGRRVLCLFRSAPDALEFAAGSGMEVDARVMRMNRVVDLAALMRGAEALDYTHVTLNPPPTRERSFGVMETGVFFDAVVKESGGNI